MPNPREPINILLAKGRKHLTQEEIQRFLVQAKAEGMYELFLLELTTGMRRGNCWPFGGRT